MAGSTGVCDSDVLVCSHSRAASLFCMVVCISGDDAIEVSPLHMAPGVVVAANREGFSIDFTTLPFSRFSTHNMSREFFRNYRYKQFHIHRNPAHIRRLHGLIPGCKYLHGY